MLYPYCALYKTVFEADTDTQPLLHGTEGKISKGYEMGTSNTATCLMLSDIISLLHPL